MFSSVRKGSSWIIRNKIVDHDDSHHYVGVCNLIDSETGQCLGMDSRESEARYWFEIMS